MYKLHHALQYLRSYTGYNIGASKRSASPLKINIRTTNNELTVTRFPNPHCPSSTDIVEGLPEGSTHSQSRSTFSRKITNQSNLPHAHLYSIEQMPPFFLTYASRHKGTSCLRRKRRLPLAIHFENVLRSSSAIFQFLKFYIVWSLRILPRPVHLWIVRERPVEKIAKPFPHHRSSRQGRVCNHLDIDTSCTPPELGCRCESKVHWECKDSFLFEWVC